MKRVIFKSLSLALALVILFTATPPLDGKAFSQPKPQLSMEEILDQYNSQIIAAQAVSELKQSDSGLRTAKDKAKAEAISLLTDAGYEAYDVNPSSFFDVEEALQTDLGDLGLKSEYSYIIVIGDGSGTPDKGAGSAFNYDYYGTTYSLRYLSVTSADDPSYVKISFPVNLLQSNNSTLIQNCLNAAIGAYLGAIWAPLGTVASICGLNISMFGTAQASTFYMEATTNWTRVYTQVYWNQNWWKGSSVEYALCSSNMGGKYYDAQQNQCLDVPKNASSSTTFSSKYYDLAWRCNAAIEAYFYYCAYDTVGNAKYYYDGNLKITHYEDF